MPLVNPTLPNDGESADASDISAPFLELLTVFNGHIGSDNLEPGILNSTNLAPNAVTTPKIADGAVTNAKLSTSSGELGAAYATYPISWESGVTIGNGTWNFSRYRKIGKNIRVEAMFTCGSTTNVTGEMYVTLPVDAAAHYVAYHPLGSAVFNDTGTVVLLGDVLFDSATRARLIANSVASLYNQQQGWTTTVPFDTATGDQFFISFEYESI